jgi:hypothetical protein
VFRPPVRLQVQSEVRVQSTCKETPPKGLAMTQSKARNHEHPEIDGRRETIVGFTPAHRL